MGYYVNIEDCSFFIERKNFEPAMQALRELDKRDELKLRSYVNGVDKPTHFSWMDAYWAENVKTLPEFLDMARFECSENEDGLFIHYFNSKFGDERVFLVAIAPYIEDGSYIIWRGEDGQLWRDRFRDGKMFVSNAVVTWPNENEASIVAHEWGGASVNY